MHNDQCTTKNAHQIFDATHPATAHVKNVVRVIGFGRDLKNVSRDAPRDSIMDEDNLMKVLARSARNFIQISGATH